MEDSQVVEGQYPGFLFDTERIRVNYRQVQEDFPRINGLVNCARDPFCDRVIGNLLCAHEYINLRLKHSSADDPVSPEDMLELNAIVHLGTDPALREEFRAFLDETREKFSGYIGDLMKWYARHERQQDDPWKVAAGLYVRILAAPQLFLDGNHRTGAMVANYCLLKKGRAPFIVTPGNAIGFFNLASDVKFTKTDIASKFKRAVGWRDELHHMRDFLCENALPVFTTGDGSPLPVFQDKGPLGIGVRSDDGQVGIDCGPAVF